MTKARVTCPCGYTWEHSSDEPLPADVRQICPMCSPAAQGTLDPGSALPPGVPPGEPATPPPGRTIGAYELLEEINRGGMGVIYKARQKGLNRLVVLKVINPGRLANPESRKRFKQEVRLAALLNHPNIVTVYDTDLEGPWPYLAMEYVPGIDLLRLVKQSGPLPVADACYYIQQAAQGLQHAFELGLVHRDIKPANLMVTPGPLGSPGVTPARPPRVKILDMGLARAITPDTGPSEHGDLTQVGVFLGTPDYVSPEQAEDSRQADIRSDIYSLGGTFYYLLTGQVPFPGPSVVAKLRRQMTEPPPSVATRRADVSPELDALIRWMMARDPADRVQSPADLLEALHRVTHGLPTGVPVPSAPQGSHSSGSHVKPALVSPAAAPLSAKGHDGGIHAIAAAADGQFLLTGGLDGRIKVWNPVRLKVVREFDGDVGPVEQLALAQNGRWAVSCSIRLALPDMRVQVWDVAAGTEHGKLRGPGDNIRCVAIAPDGRRVAAGSADTTAWVWTFDGASKKPLCLIGHAKPVTGVAFSRSGDTLLSASLDGTVRQWETETGRLKGTLDGTVGPITGLAFDPASKRLAVAGKTLAVRQREGAFVRFDGHEGPVICAAISPDGRLVASGGADQTVRVWDAEDGTQLACFTGHSKPVWTVAFGPSGDVVYSGGEGGNLHRWPVTAPPG